jgi:hypothetical protein
MGDSCVTIVNISTIRSDAILMTGESLQAIHLSNLSLGEAKKRHELRKKNDEFLEYLAWLWRFCVGEILEPRLRDH